MLELTKEECLELERRVTEQVHQASESEGAKPDLYEVICRVAARATVMTIREYERMKQDQKA